MGALWSYLWPSRSAEFDTDASLDTIDDVTGLSRRQKKVIGENWDVAKNYLAKYKADFFLAFFKVYPEYQKLFKGFADVPYDELRDNKKMQAHAQGVTYAITALVDNLDDIECLKQLLISTGERHGQRKIDYQSFQNLPPVLVDFLQEKLGTAFTPFARTAWLAAFEIMNSIIKIGLDAKA